MLPLVLLTLATTSFAYWTEIDFLNPSGLDGTTYQTRTLWRKSPTNIVDSGWQDIPEGDSGGDTVKEDYTLAYRLKDDNASTVVYKFDKSAAPLNITQVFGTYDKSVSWRPTIVTTYSSADISESKRDIWDEGTFAPVQFSASNSVISIGNSMCDDVTVTFTITDGNGNTTIAVENEVLSSWTGNSVNVAIPETLPVTGNATFGDGGSLQFVLTGEEQIVYALGNGNAPSVSATYNSYEIVVCPD